jgi:glycolate oxidase
LRRSREDAERLAFWSGRKAAFPAVGRLAPDYFCMDGTIPRRRLAEVLVRVGGLSSDTGSGWPTSFMPATATCTR